MRFVPREARREQREALGWTQADLAERVIALRIARAFEVPVEALFLLAD